MKQEPSQVLVYAACGIIVFFGFLFIVGIINFFVSL